MASVNRDDMRVARILHEDDDFVTLELPKRDDIPMRVAPLPGDDDPQPPRFLTLFFVRQEGGQVRVWDPFAG